MPLIDDNFNDYFEQPKEEPQTEATQEETAEQKEEREIKEATIERRHNRLRWILISLAAVIVIAIIFWAWTRYFHPYSESQECGYIEKVTNEGLLFKTYEGKMMSEKILPDTTRRYYCDFFFTIKDDSVAKNVMRSAGTGQRVRLSYIEYKGRLPWRGQTKIIVTDIRPDTVP